MTTLPKSQAPAKKKTSNSKSKGSKPPLAARQDKDYIIVSTTDSVNWTKVGGDIKPVPYKLTQDLSKALDFSDNVFFNNNAAMKLDSGTTASTGDEKGDLGGLETGKFTNICLAKEGCNTVLINDQPVMREGDRVYMNAIPLNNKVEAVEPPISQNDIDDDYAEIQKMEKSIEKRVRGAPLDTSGIPIIDDQLRADFRKLRKMKDKLQTKFERKKAQEAPKSIPYKPLQLPDPNSVSSRCSRNTDGLIVCKEKTNAGEISNSGTYVASDREIWDYYEETTPYDNGIRDREPGVGGGTEFYDWYSSSAYKKEQAIKEAKDAVLAKNARDERRDRVFECWRDVKRLPLDHKYVYVIPFDVNTGQHDYSKGKPIGMTPDRADNPYFWEKTPARPTTEEDGDVYSPESCKEIFPESEKAQTGAMIECLNKHKNGDLQYRSVPIGRHIHNCRTWIDNAIEACSKLSEDRLFIPMGNTFPPLGPPSY